MDVSRDRLDATFAALCLDEHPRPAARDRAPVRRR
jgi:hypothetical protein